MTNIVIIGVLAGIIVAAARYVYQEKKNGAKCIGCAVSKGCCHCHDAGASGCCCSRESAGEPVNAEGGCCQTNQE